MAPAAPDEVELAPADPADPVAEPEPPAAAALPVDPGWLPPTLAPGVILAPVGVTLSTSLLAMLSYPNKIALAWDMIGLLTEAPNGAAEDARAFRCWVGVDRRPVPSAATCTPRLPTRRAREIRAETGADWRAEAMAETGVKVSADV